MSKINPKIMNDLMHRLQSLEIDLHEAARSRELSESEYSARLERLRYALDYAGKLKSMVMAPAPSFDKSSQVDLPMMGDYSRMEQKIIMRFVSETKNHVADLSAKAREAAEWARDAATASTGWLKGLWRLSRLRRQIARTEQDLENIRRARAAVEDFISRSAIGKNGHLSSVNQKDLIAAFREFEMATARVTSLRARVRSETTRNSDMRNWLNENSRNRRLKNPEKAPPEPKDVSAVTQSVFDRLTGGAKVANERLTIARQLANALKKEDPIQASDESKVATPLTQDDLNKLPVTSKLSRKAKKKIKGVRL